MAELVVGPLLSLVKDKACNYLMDQYKVMQGMEKERKVLERKLPAILDIIQDAEEKGAFRPGVAAWLKDLKAVAYEANDAFDEFSYEALRREANKKGHHSKLGKEVVTVRNPIIFRYRMGKKLRKIVQTVEVLVTEMNAFGFRHLQQAPPSNQWRNTDPILVDSDKEIVSRSRDREKNRIVGMLLNEASNMDLMVLPIVGMGGLGKTTFVQLIYNDPAIEKHFELRRWCCVSEDFDAARIARNICETNPNHQGREEAFKLLLNLIGGMRCLIVLDDVWNRDEAKWGKLVTCLKQGGKGSVVLTTTRDAEVARIMKFGIAEAYNIEKLSPEHLKEIVQSRALGLQKPSGGDPDDIVDTIVERCAGSPLAAKAFGSILNTKATLNEWKDIAATVNICNERTGILPILKLSFDNLPSYMKQCFAFCAIFPKDYEIDVELLIQLWMAHDFIPVHEDQQPETVGEQIFRELTWRSFFEEVKQTSQQYDIERLGRRNRTICKIHNLMHDVAVSVMGKEGTTVVDTPSLKLLPKSSSSHLFFSHDNVAPMEIFLKKQSATLRTLFCTEFSLFRHISKCTSLRALHLPFPEHGVRVSHLQHLRYLNLSGHLKLKEFPDDISIMYNLQTLNLSYCKRLRQLPKAMKYMTSLRHLYTNGCKSLTAMPPGIGQMTTLQNLTYFAVGASSDCSTIGELQNLNLGGELELNGLENATEMLAKAASLESKEKLTHLALEWNSEGQEEQVQDCHKVLFALKPPDGLKMLRVINYKGNILPSWITDLNQMQHLTELHLNGFTLCVEYPQFFHMKTLQVLYLEKLDKLRFLSKEVAPVPFPALKELQLHDLEVLETWTEGKEDEVTFPELELLDIKNCPKLTSLPYSPKLNVLKLDEHKALLSLAALKSRQVFSLSNLQLHVPDVEATPPHINENHESSLSALYLKGCHFFFSSSQRKFPAWHWFTKVVRLRIFGCDMIINRPEDVLQGLVSLKYLGFFSCNKLIGPAQVNGGEPTQSVRQNQPFLNTIEIVNCESFMELFTLPMSRNITLYDCPRLQVLWGIEEQPETLESLYLIQCGSLVTIPNLPPSLKDLDLSSCWALRSVSGHLDALEGLYIYCCNELQSLDSLGELPSLARIKLENCKNLSSLPIGSYPALQQLRIKYCPLIDMKGIYKCHQQRLDSLEAKHLSHAHSSDPREGPKLREPKTWLYAVPQCRDWLIR